MCHDLAMTLSLVVVDSLAECHTRTGIWGGWNTDLPGRFAGFTCQTARYGSLKLTVHHVLWGSYACWGCASRSNWGRSPIASWPPLSPPVAQGSLQAAQRRVNQAVALVIGAAGVHPAQAGVVEET